MTDNAGGDAEERRQRADEAPCCRDEVLAAFRHADLVANLLKDIDPDCGGPEEVDDDTVRFRLGPDCEARDVVARVRQRSEELYEGFQPLVSPNHLMLHGQPNTSGNPDGAPIPSPWGRGPRPSGDLTVTVGIVDTGIAPHPWLDRAYIASPLDLETEADWDADGTRDTQAGHGTFIAGLVLAQAPGATVRVKRVLDNEGNADALSVARAVRQLGAAGAKVINLSLGCYTRSNRAPFVLRQALAALADDVVVVAAAGNYRSERAFWPAALPDVLAVGAIETRPETKLAPFSNRGPWVDAYAGGVDLLSTFLTYSGHQRMKGRIEKVDFRGWACWSGSSFAAGSVSGRIAQIAGERGISTPKAAQVLLEEQADSQRLEIRRNRWRDVRVLDLPPVVCADA